MELFYTNVKVVHVPIIEKIISEIGVVRFFKKEMYYRKMRKLANKGVCNIFGLLLFLEKDPLFLVKLKHKSIFEKITEFARLEK